METRPYTPRRTNEGQLRNLEGRMTSKQMERRSMKAAGRAHRTAAMGLGAAQAAGRVLTRGFWGRLSWLLFGLR